MAWLAIVAPYASVIAAGVGAGAAIYASNKEEEMMETKAAADTVARKEAQDLSEVKGQAEISRTEGQASARELSNQSAEEMQVGTMENVASQEKFRIEQQRLMAQERQQNEYAAKFKPGGGAEGGDTASDFLVPKISEDASLVRMAGDQGGAGLVTPLGFAV